MKKYFLALFTVALFNYGSCNKEKDILPDCIQQKINLIKQQAKWNPPAEVREYIYKGKKVFYFSSNCCDQFNIIVDEDCNYICAPDGGFTGRGDGKCADFNLNAREIKLVWKDER